MELNINSPAYYSNQYFIDDDVYRMCQDTHLYLKNKKCSDVLNIIGITPIVAPDDMFDNGLWKEEIRFLNNKECVSIFIKIDFEKYHNSGSNGRIELMQTAILNAVKRIKTKGKFNYILFENDINMFWKQR